MSKQHHNVKQSSKTSNLKLKSKMQSDQVKIIPDSSNVRKITPPKYKSFRLSKRISQPKPKLLGGVKLLKKSLKILLGRRKLFLGIIVVYFLASLVLVKGLSVTSNLQETKSGLDQLIGGGWDRILTGATLFSVLLSNVNNPATEVGGVYQSLLLVGVSLATIWALRQSLSQKKSHKIQTRDAFYKGLYPIVPFMAVVSVIGFQMLPLVLANFIYSLVIAGGIAVTVLEKSLWILLLLSLVILSTYMVCSSLFAVYIVTLPDVRPIQALKSARELVRYRRLLVLKRLMFLPLVVFFSMAVIIAPVIFFSPNFAEWLFFFMSMGALVVSHSYVYVLYRELL